MKIENIGFKEAIEILAEKAGITLPTLNNQEDNLRQKNKEKVYEINSLAANFYHENLYKPTAKVAQEYVKKRKLGNSTLKNFLIGYSEGINKLYFFLKEKGFTDEEILLSSLVYKTKNNKFIDRFNNRLIFPIQDVKNRVIAFGGRVLDNSLPKYINSPENIVYSKGRNLFGLNVAKKNSMEKIIMVEGYMDAISLHQRGISNVVASLGTALTEAQGRLLRKYSKKIIISYDSDSAGQAATLRGLEILNNLGCDVRILQMEGAKDPDEYVIKYGNVKFNELVDRAISLVEFKIKMLKNNLNTDNVNDKIKFLNEIAKIISTVDNKIEQEIYIDKISTEYKISKEAIYAQINKLNYANKSTQILKQNTARITVKKEEMNTSEIIKREQALISLLINGKKEVYEQVKDKITEQDLKNEENKIILKKIYEEFEKGNNIDNILDSFSDNEEVLSLISKLMIEDNELKDYEKATKNVLNAYEREKLLNKKKEIIDKINNSKEQKEILLLEKELQEVIIKLVKIK